jgi:hypothetical protein
MCAEDIRGELKSSQGNLDICSQLGAGPVGNAWGLLVWTFFLGYFPFPTFHFEKIRNADHCEQAGVR